MSTPTSLRACAACGNAVDPLRAPMVAILDGKFTYFCSRACKESTTAVSLVPPPVVAKPVEPKPIEPEPVSTPEPPPSITASITASITPSIPSISIAMEAPRASLRAKDLVAAATTREAGTEGALEGKLLRFGALFIAVSAVALALIDARADFFRLLLATIATGFLGMLGLLTWIRLRRASPLDGAVEAELGSPLLAASFAAMGCVAVAWSLHWLDKPGKVTAIGCAVWVVLAAAAAEAVAWASSKSSLADAHAVLAALDPPSSSGHRTKDLSRVGDVITLAEGDRVRCDLTMTEGSIVAELWSSRALRMKRTEGDPVPAGSIVREGSGIARVAAVGRSRAFARLLTDALERSDRASPGLRALDRAAPIAAVAVAIVAIVLGFVTKGTMGPTAVAAMAAAASILIPPARRLAVRDQLSGIVEACRRGAAFRDADAFTRAGSVRSTIFALRGTMVSAQPDACDVEALGSSATPADVLALAAGAESAVSHPIAHAIARTARARGVRPVDVRNATFEPGLGITGELASSAQVIVGSRALCLRAHVATAEHEERIVELEKRGRDVVIVARDGRAIGLLVFSVPLRAGALAAVQRLHDIEVEPVLLGGGSRDRLESIGRAVDIEHVRPEVLPRDRHAEVRRVAQSGGPVAVVGRPSTDPAALAAADVGIALGEAGSAPEQNPIALAHDSLVTAVDVLALAQATRARVSATLAAGLAPVVIAALPVAFGLVRPAYAPLAALAATVALGVRDLVAAALPEGGRMEDT